MDPDDTEMLPWAVPGDWELEYGDFGEELEHGYADGDDLADAA